MKEISGNTAFVTGGASGIGRGMAQALLESGARVAIADLRPDHLAEAREALGSEAIFLQVDVCDRAALAAAADQAEEALGPVQIVCNNAGVGVLGNIRQTTYADWDWTLSVNLGGVINGVQTFLPRMLARGTAGHVVNTSSIGAMLPGPNGAAYLTSKAAVIALSECMAMDLAQTDIGVTVLIPGPTASNIHQVAQMRPAAYRDTGLSEIERDLARGPIFPNGRPPIEVGRSVVEAIRSDRLYLFTHNQFREGLQERFDAIMTGFPPGLPDMAEASQWGFPVSNPLYRNIADKFGNGHEEET